MVLWWCFHVDAADEESPPPSGPVRVMGSDGQVRVYHGAIRASEVMAEHPRLLVCRSDSLYIGRRVPAMSPEDELQPGNTYFLLPLPFFHSVLSFVTVAASLAAFKRPFDVHKTPAGTLQIKLSAGDEQSRSRVCTTPALEKDYRQLVGCSSTHWKPNLQTITESKRETKTAWRFNQKKQS